MYEIQFSDFLDFFLKQFLVISYSINIRRFWMIMETIWSIHLLADFHRTWSLKVRHSYAVKDWVFQGFLGSEAVVRVEFEEAFEEIYYLWISIRKHAIKFISLLILFLLQNAKVLISLLVSDKALIVLGQFANDIQDALHLVLWVQVVVRIGTFLWCQWVARFTSKQYTSVFCVSVSSINAR